MGCLFEKVGRSVSVLRFYEELCSEDVGAALRRDKNNDRGINPLLQLAHSVGGLSGCSLPLILL